MRDQASKFALATLALVAALAATAGGAPQRAPSAARGEAGVEGYEELAAAWEQALLAWAREGAARPQADAEQALGPSPAADFWPRFVALAAAGEQRALPWLVQHVDQLDGRPAPTTLRARRLVELVRAAGKRAWVADVVPLLVQRRALVDDDEALEALFRSLAGDAVEPERLRREARLGLAALEEERDRQAAFELQVDAFRLPGEPRIEVPGASAEVLDVVALRVERALREEDAEFDRRHTLQAGEVGEAGGIRVLRPGAPPAPRLAYAPILGGLAHRGSLRAALWLLENTAPERPDERERLRRQLVRVAAAELEPGDVASLARHLDGLIGCLGVGPVEQALAGLMERAGDEETEAQLLYSFGNGVCRLGAGRLERGLEALGQVVERYPASAAAGRARGKLFRYRNLVVGRACPDFETNDVDGAALRLSDYRGKVTVLTFWGFWCGACVEALPRERALVERYEERPFAIVGVNTDTNQGAYRRQVQEHGVTWRSSWQGSTRGPLVSAWGIDSYPTVLVLDANHVIRHLDPRGEELERVVAGLMEELEHGAR